MMKQAKTTRLVKVHIVQRDGRATGWTLANKPKSWRVLTQFEFSADNPPQVDESLVPGIVEHWKKDKSALGYARFYGLTAQQAVTVYAMAIHNNRAVLGINRWGRIASFKLKEAHQENIMNSYTIITMNTGNWRVHKAGCKDIQKDLLQSNGNPYTAAYESIDALIKAEIQSLDESFGEPSGYGSEHFEVLPCASSSSCGSGTPPPFPLGRRGVR